MRGPPAHGAECSRVQGGRPTAAGLCPYQQHAQAHDRRRQRSACCLAGADNFSNGANRFGTELREAEAIFEREASAWAADFSDTSHSALALTSVDETRDVRGLRSTPQSSGVNNATTRFSLPDPTLAVRNLIEGAQYAHLCTNMSHMHHRRAGYPFGMLIDFASDGAGYPIFCLSPLSIHSHNIHEDPRCSLVVQMPGWLGLSNARVTMFGDVYQLPDEMQEAARGVFLDQHSGNNGPESVRVASEAFRFYRMMTMQDIYFQGGFGTMQWIDPSRYVATQPDNIVCYHPHETIDMLNSKYKDKLERLFNKDCVEDCDAAVISIDARGMDVRVRHMRECSMHRVPFDALVQTPSEAARAVERALAAELHSGVGGVVGDAAEDAPGPCADA